MKVSKPVVDPDFLGVVTSLCCIVHCLAFPLLLGMVSGLGLVLSPELPLEKFFILSGGVVAFFAFRRGYLRYHRSKRVVILALGGFMIIFLSHTFFSGLAEEIVTVSGALIIAAAHLVNGKLISANSKHI